ncbi:MAG: hypothetical protein G01um101466_593 [Parcubacteria group bacterium Gr01-1014_66]|nr:MAG: hypothetical protein G01um101466_593 [Parcubacteria group bacterium Gr01-1014_66]
MNTQENNYAFIDSQNVHKGTHGYIERQVGKKKKHRVETELLRSAFL